MRIIKSITLTDAISANNTSYLMNHILCRRSDDSTTFWNGTWADYKNGFNNGLSNNLWLGLDRTHALTTKDPNVTLRTELYGNRASNSRLPNGFWFDERGVRVSFSLHRLIITTLGHAMNMTEWLSIGFNKLHTTEIWTQILLTEDR